MENNQQQYITNFHDNFKKYIEKLLAIIEHFIVIPQVSSKDKHVIEVLKSMLTGREVYDIEKDLKRGTINYSTLNKITKLNKELFDYAVDHISVDLFVKEFLKHLYYAQNERNKECEVINLRSLNMLL